MNERQRANRPALSLDHDISLATELVTSAAALAAAMRTDPDLRIDRKTSVSDVVTAADHAAEALVVSRLTDERPDDGLLGEEGTSRAGTSGRRWIIDPVDGTYNFASGSDYWCSALALVDGDELVLGAVAHHGTGTVYVGGPDVPTTCNGVEVPRIGDEDVALQSVATYLHPGDIDRDHVREPFLAAARHPATVRMLGSGSMDLVGVTTGRIGCWFQHSTPDWDWFPGAALVAGVGGTSRRVEHRGLRWSVAGGATAVSSLVTALESAT